MDKSQFTKPAGRIITTARDYQAFVPSPLPRTLPLAHETILLLSTADRALGELAGMARVLPNPELLVGLLGRREAVLSSRIEGTQASLSDLAIFEAAGEELRSMNPDVIEVSNYRRTLEYGAQRLQDLPLSLRFVRELHAQLLTGIGGQEKTPGEFRTSQNWIGAPGSSLNNATYVPPPPDELMGCLADWESFLHEEPPMPPLIRCAVMHYQFEAIHPFLDGNGRVGRLLILFYLISLELLSSPVLFLSPYVEANRDRYYSLLRAVSEKSAWDEWCRFFLQGVVEQSKDALTRSRQLLDLQQRYRERLLQAKAPNSAFRLLAELFLLPATSIRLAANNLGFTWMTARNAILVLIKVGVLREVTGKQRDRVFVAEEVMDSLDSSHDWRPASVS